jgi:hypothetical protein
VLFVLPQLNGIFQCAVWVLLQWNEMEWNGAWDAMQADLILLVATESGISDVTRNEQETVWHVLNPPPASVEAHPVRLSESSNRISTAGNSATKLTALEYAAGESVHGAAHVAVHGACFTADSDDVRCFYSAMLLCLVLSELGFAC